jgi:hypothetical protein
MVGEARPSNPSTGEKRLSHRRRQILLQVVVGMIILICGIVIGWGAAVLQLKDKMMMPPGPRPPTREVVEDMEARYDLTPEQAKQVGAAFGKRRDTLQTLFEEFRRKSETEFQTLSAYIKKILTPGQYERWEQDFQRRRRPGQWERGPGRPGDRGPGHGGPGDRGPGRGFGERGPGLMRPGPKEPFEEKPGSDSAGLSEPNSTTREQHDSP